MMRRCERPACQFKHDYPNSRPIVLHNNLNAAHSARDSQTRPKPAFTRHESSFAIRPACLPLDEEGKRTGRVGGWQVPGSRKYRKRKNRPHLRFRAERLEGECGRALCRGEERRAWPRVPVAELRLGISTKPETYFECWGWCWFPCALPHVVDRLYPLSPPRLPILTVILLDIIVLGLTLALALALQRSQQPRPIPPIAINIPKHERFRIRRQTGDSKARPSGSCRFSRVARRNGVARLEV